jgi:broad specificity phosphatase PhoE
LAGSRATVAERLLIVPYAVPAQPRFGPGPAELPSGRPPELGRVVRWVCAPEPAAAATASWLGAATTELLSDLRECDLGDWRGRSLDEIGSLDPIALLDWLNDPDARPHHGETLTELVARVARVLARRWPDGRTVLVASPLVARALVVRALQAAPSLIFQLDVPQLGRITLSRSSDRWRLRL